VVNKDWLDIVILEDYLDGKLDPRTMNRVEREALEDPFVAEALAGLSASPKKSLESISLLQKQLQERIAEQQHTKKTALITWQRLSIAATAAVLFISVGIIFWMKQNNYQDMLAKQAKQPKEVEVTIASKELKDSLIKAQTQVAAAKPPKAETPKAEKSPSRAMEEAIKAAKTSAYASTAKAKMKSISTANPSPVAASSVDISSAALARTVIKGKVLDEASGQPLGNAAIYVKGTSIRTFTNNAGEFSVTSDSLPKNPEITAAYIGYENAIAQAKVNESNVLVLKENKTALNEVVVRGYQKRSRDQTTGSSFVVTGKEIKDVPVANVEQLLQGKVAGLNIQNATGYPSDGWSAFKAYLIKENPYSSEIKPGQSAEFKFSVSRSGRPTNIKVVRGLSKSYDEAAKTLIRNWRKWNMPKDSGPVTVTLEY